MNYLVITLASLLIVGMIGIKAIHHYSCKRQISEKVFVDASSPRRIEIQWQYVRQIILYTVCSVAIIWYLVFRYIPLFSYGNEQGWIRGVGRMAGNQSQIDYNKGWSMLLMLDLCTFLGLATPVVVLFDHKQKFTHGIASLSVLGACLTFYGGYLQVDAPWTLSYLFFGNWNSNNDLPLSFMIHMWMLGLGLYVLLWKRRWTLRDNFTMCAIGFGYMFYVLMVTSGLEITTHATALVINDFIPIFGNEHAVYSDFMKLFNVPDSNWRIGAVIAWFTFFLISNFVIPSLNIYVCYKQTELENLINAHHAHHEYNHALNPNEENN